ncbi:MAG: sugar ABC transporter permease [Potamolinea sp.]
MKLDSIQAQEQRTGWLMVTPAFLILSVIFVYPILRSFWLSLFTKNLGTKLKPIFSGLDNYGRMMGDSRFWQTLWNTIIFTSTSVLLELVLGMAIALILHQAYKGRSLVRTVALLPWALPTALIGLAWTWIFNDQFGVWNDILIRLGIIQTGVNWLGNPITAMMAVIAADVWKTTPFISILLLAGLQSIPTELYEAYAIDGATPWQSFTKITLPLLMPQIVIVLLFRFAGAFGVFDLIQVMTGGGPGGTTEVVSLYIYSTVMRYLDFGYGAALVVVTFLFLVAIVLIGSFFLSKYRTKVSEV